MKHIKTASTLATLTGTSGNDFLDGGANAILTGLGGADQLVLRSGYGHVTVTDFNPAEDRVLFDYGSYSDIMFLGQVSDGMVFDNFIHTATWTVTAADVNGDGITDTHITVNSDSIDLLGVTPSQLYGWNFQGG